MTHWTPEDLAELRKRSEEWAGISTSASESADRREADEATLIKSLLSHSPGALEWFLALLDEIDAKAARITELERALSARDEDNPCAQAIEDLWKAVILAHKPDYGPWEYPAQAFRHLLAEFDDLRSKVAAQDKTLRSWAGPVAGYAEDPAQQLKWAQGRIAELEKELAGAKQLLGMFEAEAKAKGLAVDVMLDAMNEEAP